MSPSAPLRTPPTCLCRPSHLPSTARWGMPAPGHRVSSIHHSDSGHIGSRMNPGKSSGRDERRGRHRRGVEFGSVVSHRPWVKPPSHRSHRWSGGRQVVVAAPEVADHVAGRVAGCESAFGFATHERPGVGAGEGTRAGAGHARRWACRAASLRLVAMPFARQIASRRAVKVRPQPRRRNAGVRCGGQRQTDTPWVMWCSAVSPCPPCPHRPGRVQPGAHRLQRPRKTPW